MMSGIRAKRIQRVRMEELRAELAQVHADLACAYGLFDRTADAALLEASILEISALRVRYDRLLRAIKDLMGDTPHDMHRHSPAGHRGGLDLAAVEAVEKADQMGV